MMLALLMFVTLLPALARALDNGRARTPPMGWNSWNKFGCNVSEELLLSTGRAMHEHGLVDLGYNIISIDDCWQADSRDSKTGAPLADPERFPHGMSYLVKELAKLGISTGIYSSAGTLTCAGRFGSLGYEKIDAATYRQWGISHLKYDNCANQGLTTPPVTYKRYAAMRDALDGSNITFALCQWGEDAIWNFGWTLANSYRITGDIGDTFDRYDDRCPCQNSFEPCQLAGIACSTMNIAEKAAGVAYKSKIGAWGDLDGLEIGNGKQRASEYEIQFSLWALVKSPLILGHDIAASDSETLRIISNKHIIALNQDTKGAPGYRISKKAHQVGGSTQIWKVDIANSTYGMLIINATPSEQIITVDMADFFTSQPTEAGSLRYDVFDLWQDGAFFATIHYRFSITIAAHAQKTFMLVPYQESRGLVMQIE